MDCYGAGGGGRCELEDENYEAEERRERREEDEWERVELAIPINKLKREARRREMMQKFRLAIAEWEMGNGRFGSGNGFLDCGRDVEGEEKGEFGSWLDIALRRSKFQRRISPERSILGGGPDFGDDEKSALVSNSYAYVRQRTRSVQQTLIVVVSHCAEQVLLHRFYYIQHELFK